MLPNRWKTEHYALAMRELAKLKKLEKLLGSKKSLPQVPENLLEFIETAKPKSEDKIRSFPLLPFWKSIYTDDYSFKMIIGGRRIYKTTYVTDLLTHEAITRPGSQIAYITFNQENLRTFSRQKLYPAFQQNPILARYLKKSSNVGELSLNNGSRIYCLISNNHYRNVEGKTLNHVILDEIQYQPIEDAQRVVQTMSTTNGSLTICGIGGEAGSSYEAFWKQSSQNEWVFDDPDWRKKLQFDENGLVEGKYIEDVVSGRWISQNPENKICQGYHMSQIIFPRIPLTIDDAIQLYKKNPMYSIEYIQKHNPQSFFITNVLGQFNKALARPLTPEMILGCMNPHRNLGLLADCEISELKETHGKKIQISMGVDFGSGNSSSTVIAIVIKRKLKKDLNQYVLASIQKRSAENQMDQAEYILERFKNSGCDIGVADLGYGANQVKFIQGGGHSRLDGKKVDGVGDKKFLGCRTVSDESQPLQMHPEKKDEHGDTTSMVSIDKTMAIQEFIDLFESFVPDFENTQNVDSKAHKFVIPFKNEDHVDWLIPEFTKITRKDLLDENAIDSRLRARKEFNHPPDSVMAIIYAMTGLDIKEPEPWIITGSIRGPDPSTLYFYPD
ncbi:MAG: hypothetical protein ACREBB_01780 [Nitrosotalea sp.]